MVRRLIAAAAGLLLSVQLGLADETTKGKLSIWLGYPETLDAFRLGQAEFKKQMFEPGKKPGTVRVTIAKNIDAAARVLLDHVERLLGARKSDDWALKTARLTFS